MIYCIEDDNSIRELMLYTLRISGFEAEGFETATEALNALNTLSPDLILLDIMLPGGGLLEKLVCFLVPDAKEPEKVSILDERLLNTPSIALERCHILAGEMAQSAARTLRTAISCVRN